MMHSAFHYSCHKCWRSAWINVFHYFIITWTNKCSIISVVAIVNTMIFSLKFIFIHDVSFIPADDVLNSTEIKTSSYFIFLLFIFRTTRNLVISSLFRFIKLKFCWFVGWTFCASYFKCTPCVLRASSMSNYNAFDDASFRIARIDSSLNL